MRIAIVNDLLIAVEALRRAVASCPEHVIAWIACDGEDAVRKCASDPPDLILMDLIMPVMNGVEATRQIMCNSPCAILVVTATVEGNVALVFEAMGHGALDAVNTPIFGKDGSLQGAKELLAKIESISHLIGRRGASRIVTTIVPAARRFPKQRMHLVVIGASTGGPTALAEILSHIPEDLPAAFVLIQHVDVRFASDFAKWLDGRTHLHVRPAVPGCRPELGTAWLAATNDHLIMAPDLTLDYSRDPVECFYRPSVDVFLKRAAVCWPYTGVAALLTGMGRDGAEGLLLLKKSGWFTIAQDEHTSVVYGMPKAAKDLGAVDQVLPLPGIASAIIDRVLNQLPLNVKENAQ
ncbi:MAG: chemotaxis response regulator protein-glutamate methylesterase [Verrucomicrobia bacterium]|nr:chemotaxis response regulator protein-glutamate methylesterase [Verrucomicrobiota bacterium]